MIFYFGKRSEALAKAEELREMHVGTDWRVVVLAPRWRGDKWAVAVG